MHPRLIAAIDNGATVVTASARLARSLQLDHARIKKRTHAGAWERPGILTWDEWLRSLAEQASWSAPAEGGIRQLLNTAQERFLWEQVIGEHPAGDLLDVPATARLAREAWTLIQSWRLPDPAREQFATAEVKAFAGWMRVYYQRCRDEGWMDTARLSDTLVPPVNAARIAIPAEIFLVGFDRLTPQQRTLLRAAQARGCTLNLLRGPQLEPELRRSEFVDREQEIDAAARWARALLGDDPLASIGIVVPGLADARQQVLRIFDDVLMPGSELPASTPALRPFNLSMGQPLNEYSIVRDALLVLGLGRGTIGHAQLSRLLRSPFVTGGMSEAPGRAAFDVWLRGRGFTQLRVAMLPRLIGEMRARNEGDVKPLAMQALANGVQPLLKALQTTQSAAAWTHLLEQLLEVWGWPGERKLDSVEYQTVQAFREQMAAFASLETIASKLTIGSALDAFTRMLGETVFQPSTPEVPVQILGILDTPGLEFDHLWISGLNADNWPRRAAPNPFVPLAWQREHSVPNATAESTLEVARKITRRLLRSSKDIVLSSALRDGEKELLVSPLIREIPIVDAGDLGCAELTDYRGALLSTAKLQLLEDEIAPPVETRGTVTGGTRILRLQAACPFRAFAELRLGAAELPEPSAGFDAMERGTLVHLALELIWHQIGSRDVLQAALASDYLEVQVWETADKVLSLLERRRVAPIGTRYRALEHQRLVRLLMRWLVMEETRADFSIVETEGERMVEVGPLKIRTRVDRIDSIPGHGIALIDYKSGSGSPGDWMGGRPNEPQLPLYALAQEGELVAVLFARFRPGDQCFKGVARAAELVPNVKAFDDSTLAKGNALKWSELIPAWRRVLTELATAYADGDAKVDPKSQDATCRLCHLHSLCRIRDARFEQETTA